MRWIAAVLLLAAALAGGAGAAWLPAGGGSGAALAATLPAGNVPSPSASMQSVTVTWTANTFAGGTPVPAYVVRRFNAIGGAEATVLSGCSGLIAATTCIENNVPIGTWTYTATPAVGAWRGSESAQSAPVVVL